MEYLSLHPEADLEEIATKLQVNYKTISEHMRRLVIAGLVEKRHESVIVHHKLSDRGMEILNFLRNIEKG